MAYNFTKSDGVTAVSVADGAINTTDFSIGLVGKNVSGYGQAIAEDLVWMLENFANTTAPSSPTTGQLWYDSDTDTMNVYNGTSWVGLLSGGTGGDFIVGGDILPSADCGPPGSDIGAPALQFCNVYANTYYGDLIGTATQARYADLAERFHADAVYEVGTVVRIGGEFEVTVTTDHADTEVLGVVSAKPGYLMNSEAGDEDTHPAIALAGRIPVKISGSVKKGQRLVSSQITGKATVADANANPFAVIGRALEDSDDDTVMMVVGVK